MAKTVHAVLENLPTPSSDHYPIMLLCEPGSRQKRNHSRFRFENAWLFDPEFKNFVNNKWNSYGSYPIVDKLELCAADLAMWNQNHFQQLKKEINDCRKQLENLRVQVDSSNILYFNNLRNRMNRLLIQEDAFWRQRAKTHWLRDGDLNTKFFHAAATSRKKVNKIISLVDRNDVRVTDEEQLCTVAKNYFVNLFLPQESDTTPVIEAISASITMEDNVLLEGPFVIEELKAAIFSMKPDKCAGPDGFNLGFFQKFWPLCGEELFTQCCNWLETGIFPSSLNSTNIALIPKGDTQIS